MPTGLIGTAKLFPRQIPCRDLVWDAGSIPQTFDIEYEGVAWEVVGRIKSTEDGDLPGIVEKDFTEQLMTLDLQHLAVPLFQRTILKMYPWRISKIEHG